MRVPPLRNARMLGSTEASVVHQEKVVFVWNEPRPLVRLPSRLTFRSVRPEDLAAFASAIERVLEGSLDTCDKARLLRSPGREVARWYMQPDSKIFAYDSAWWQLAYAADQSIVGFTQPVVYKGCAKDGLEEGTIHYIGVLPEHRGHGYIVDLLSAATRTMQDVGVWRIYCDTDTNNSPMIDAFRRVGYEQGETRDVAHTLET